MAELEMKQKHVGMCSIYSISYLHYTVKHVHIQHFGLHFSVLNVLYK